LDSAKNEGVAFLVVGDVFSATTHTDLYLTAVKEGINVIVINNASILNVIGLVGLELYKYGKTTSIPFHNKDVEAPYDVVKQNKKNKLHTLLLLDIDAEHNKYMTVNEAIEYLLRVEAKRKEKAFTKQTKCIGVARLGGERPKIISGTAEQLLKKDFGEPLHSLIVPGELHFVEEEAIKVWER
jgi:diphthine synthase